MRRWLRGRSASPRTEARHVLVHYHIFKNAGTSIDVCLQRSFGNRWASYEKAKGDYWTDSTNLTTSDMLQRFAEQADLRAISSHMARWPPPTTDEIQAHPIVFLRHPIDRVGSVYTYRRKIRGPEAVDRTLAEYVDWLLGPDGNIAVRSFQTLFLSDDTHIVNDGGPKSEVNPNHYKQAVLRLEGLPVFGLVEHFGESVQRMQAWLTPFVPELDLQSIPANESEGRATLMAQRIRDLADALGQERYDRLVRANEADFDLFEHASRLFNHQSV
ncbi:MAG: sulfotransferase family 2 domain-containing protein [Candidatus Dormibacteraeota bacterium]|uniref:Sulfotransferase family 2 domain-containing protein n=1 Tax=Candidatus Amunia macphersoniae TaxID=3127014 RepID=A0A934NE01_9BACT|nr:sulfotransferase family 2 domain-containing protein [Candidatus Dormibacteraeota bacterium]